MTEPPHPDDAAGRAPASSPSAATDAELIIRVRAGDVGAYEELFLRHRDVAIRYARRLAGGERAEDLSSEAFAKILDLLKRGKGPDLAFRAYLLTTVRTSYLNSLRTAQREDLFADHDPVAKLVPITEDPDARFDRNAICRAFLQLPERWQKALWLTAVEGLSNEEVGEHLGIHANAVASLSFRARAGLRQAFLTEHLHEITDPDCKPIVEMLPAYLRTALHPRRVKQVEDHLDTCLSCATAAVELGEVDSNLRGLILPLGLTFAGSASALGAIPLYLVGRVTRLARRLGSRAGAVATAATVAVAGLVVAQHLEQDPLPPPTTQTEVDGSITPSAPVRGTTGPSLPPTASPDRRPTPPRPGTAIPPTPDDHDAPTPLPAPGPAHGPDPSPQPPLPSSLPTTPHPTPDPTPDPTTDPTPDPTTDPTPGGPTTRIAPGHFGTATDEPEYRYSLLRERWEHVTLPIHDVAPGSTLIVRTTRTMLADQALTDGTGWTCEPPTVDWLDGSWWSSTQIACRYDGAPEGAPADLQFDYQTAPDADLEATLDPDGPDGPGSEESLVLLLQASAGA